MKVLNIINAEKPFLMQQLDALNNNGIEIDIVKIPGEYRVDDDSAQSRTPLAYLKAYPTTLRHSFRDYDIIHAHYGLTAPLAIAQWNRPIVLSLWGRDLFGKYGWVTKTAARYFDAVIVRSEEMRAELGIDAHVVERGVDTKKFQPIDRNTAKKDVSWEQDAKHILFPYAPSREKKDHSRAVQVVREVNSLVDSEVKLQTVYNEPHARMPVYMNAADLLLMTSTPKSEGSPNTVKEAMACNTPVVTTDVGDVRKLLTGVSNSFVSDSTDELVQHTTGILKSGKSSNGREKVIEELRWEDTAEQIASIYESIL